MPATDLNDRIRAYRRNLPGGGFVAIEVCTTRPRWWRQRGYTGHVLVERRSAPRAGEHPSPVIARATGNTVEEVIQALLPAARCNETIGAALLRISAVSHALR